MFDEALSQRVGLWLLALLALAVGLVATLSGRTLAAVHEYHVQFSRIAGLQAGHRVRLSGQDVGQIKAVSFAPGGSLRVDVWVKRGFRRYVHQNSEFYVGMGSTTILGEPSLEIGPPRGEPGPELAPGATVRGIDPPRLDHVLQTVYDDLTVLTEELHEQQPVIDELLRALDGLLETLDEIPSDPDQLIRIRDQISVGTVRALDLIAALRAGTDDGVRLRGTAREVSQLLQRIERELDGLARRFDRASAGWERVASVFSAAERQRIAGAFRKLSHAADLGARVAGDLAELSALVESGRGTIGAFRHDLEIFDDIKQINRMLQNQPWLGAARPEKSKPE
ncbi:MAG TPA: MlaD family protein [Polyangia bacterium]|nr:MlaD family protein [Polyangia bacterium]